MWRGGAREAKQEQGARACAGWRLDHKPGARPRSHALPCPPPLRTRCSWIVACSGCPCAARSIMIESAPLVKTSRRPSHAWRATMDMRLLRAPGRGKRGLRTARRASKRLVDTPAANVHRCRPPQHITTHPGVTAGPNPCTSVTHAHPAHRSLLNSSMASTSYLYSAPQYSTATRSVVRALRRYPRKAAASTSASSSGDEAWREKGGAVWVYTCEWCACVRVFAGLQGGGGGGPGGWVLQAATWH